MRNVVLILFCSFFALGFYGCSNDDDGVKDSNIVGKWEHAAFGMMLAGELQLMPYDGECDSKRDYIELTADGIMKSMLYDSDCESGEYLEVSYKYEESNILLEDDEGTIVWKVLELRTTLLRLEVPLQDGFVILEFERK